jgi:hypothetical protein
MGRLLLILALAATQCLSLGASPLYLCLSANGSMRVDLGPAGCRCAHEDACEHACTAEDGCEDHHNGYSPVDGTSFGDPCDCIHVQITEPQSATRSVTSQQSERDGEYFFDLPASHVAAAAGAQPALDCWSNVRSPHPPSLALTVLSSVVIRC